MKHIFKFRTLSLSISALLVVMLFSKCTNKEKEGDKKCCEGYTGKITNPEAEKLINRCHFLEKDSILAWTARYERFSKENIRDSSTPVKDPAAISFLKNDSYSFNSCIIKKILCDSNSIGLRVLYGMSADKRIHIILVGIQPDYGNLYIVKPEECCGSKSLAETLGANGGGSGGGNVIGGAEYGQMP